MKLSEFKKCLLFTDVPSDMEAFACRYRHKWASKALGERGDYWDYFFQHRHEFSKLEMALLNIENDLD